MLLGWAVVAVGQQQTDNCPGANPSKSTQKQITANGFSFWYYSLVFESGVNQWCHDRKTSNEGPAVYVTWSDVLGDILSGHMFAGKTGTVRVIAFESGETEDVGSTVKYGPWEPTYEHSASVYRSMSELRTAARPDPRKQVFAPIWSGLDALVVDKSGRPHSVSVRLHSEVEGTSPFKIKYRIANKSSEGSFSLGDALKPGSMRGVEVIWEGKAGQMFKSGTRLGPREGETFSLQGVPKVSLEAALLKILIDGQVLVSGRVTAYSPSE
jgi:hypothetical protein